MVGNNGLTDNIITEIINALDHHELIKVRVSGQERADRKSMLETIAERTQSDLVQMIGNIGAFYRAAKEPTIQLPRG
jgi:RNA-binding protein